MKYLACADIHACKEPPHYRRDKYFETCLGKLDFGVGTANDEDATLLIAGDIFDSSRVGTTIINRVTEILQRAKYTPLAVVGQHDLRYHSGTLTGTPIYNLHLSGAIKLLDPALNIYHDNVVGAHWEGTVPEVGTDILLIHKCITPDKPPFFLDDAIEAKHMARLHPQFKVIVSGDYHVPFVHQADNGTVIVNCGTLMRNKKNMLDYQPFVYLIDVDGKSTKVTEIPVPIEPYADVFNVDQIEYDEKHGIVIDTTKLKELIDTDNDDIEFEEVVSQVVQSFENNGLNVNQDFVKEVLTNAKN